MRGVGSESDARREGRRRFVVAGGIGAALALVVFMVVLLDGNATLFAVGRPPSDLSGELAQFYDAQAHSLLDLKWQVPAQVLGVEAFYMDDGTYIYFGPWPALLRMPIAAATDSFDGRLTQVSMLLAYLVAIVFTIRLAWRVRVLARGDAAVGWGEAVAIGGFLFALGAGSALVYLASERVVFNEAIFWGIAWSLGALELILAFAITLRTRYLVWASLLTLLALFSRAALGVGPLVALGLLLLVTLVGRGQRMLGIADGLTRRFALPVAIACLVPISLYVGLNLLKFGTPFSLPFYRQAASIFSATHRAVLQRNGGSLVGLQFVPTNILQYFRPDAIRFVGDFPWVAFPGPATILGGVRFDQAQPASSVTATMPLLSTLGIVGVFGLIFGAPGGRTFAPLRAPVLGAAAAGLITLAFGFIANRYVADFVPLLVLLGLVGLYVLISWAAARPRAVLTRVVWGGVAVLALLSVWFSTGLAVAWQRGWEPAILVGTTLPEPKDLGTVFIQRDCEGLFRSTGSEWRGLELTPETGRFRMRVRFPADPEARREPLVVTGAPGAMQQVFVEYLPDGEIAFGARLEGHGKLRRGRALAVDRDRDHQLDIDIVPQVPHVLVRLDGLKAFEWIPNESGVVKPVRNVKIGANPVGGKIAESFTGELSEIPIATPDCREFQQRRARGLGATDIRR